MSNLPEHRPNVILVTFDSLAARDMSLYGYDKMTTPHLDAFAKTSFVFKNASANCNSTLPSLISILTGKYPFSHNCRRLISLGIQERSENMASVLKQEGYQVSAVLGLRTECPIVSRLPFVRTDKKTRGLKANFSLWRECLVGMLSTALLSMWPQQITGRALGINSPDATIKKALDLSQTLLSPFFLWVHIYPPHAPYLPSPKFRYAFLSERTLDTFKAQKRYLYRGYPRELQPVINQLRSRYDELLLNADESFGTFWEALKRKGYAKNSIVIITSDHGEMFEKGYQGHGGTFLYQPMVHVPFILRMPNQSEGKEVIVNAEHIDIAPTILDMLGMEVPTWMEGVSLKKALEQRPVQNRPKFSISGDLFRKNRGSRTGCMTVIHEAYKLYFHLGKREKELYDLSKDPEECANLIHLKKEESRILENMIRQRVPASLLTVLQKTEGL